MLILCNKNDNICLALYKYLMAANARARLVTDEELVYARSWEHTLDEQGKTRTTIKLQNGDIISSSYTGVVFNRIRFLPMPYFIDSTDKNYAEMEMYALYISFLRSINHLLMEPLETRHLSLEQDNTLFYFQKATESRIPVLDYHFTSSPRTYFSPHSNPTSPLKNSTTPYPKWAPYLVWQDQPTIFMQPFTTNAVTYVAGKTIISNEQIPYNDEIRDFVKSIGRTFVELYFTKTKKEWKMYHINVFPRIVHNKLVKALAEWMMEGRERRR